MGDVTLDDIQVALVPVSKKSTSVYKSVVILYKSIFRAAIESKVIDKNPTTFLTAEGGGVPQQEKQALTDEQSKRLLEAVKGLQSHTFVMLGLYAGLRREEILALQWDSVFLDTDAPYLKVCRAWHTENNRPVILTELKTKAAERKIPLPDNLAECLREVKAASTSKYVICNRDGDPLTYTQFKRLWQFVVTRTAKERSYYRYENGKRVKHTINPVLGQKAAHNGKVLYSLDFDVTPHQLRHTYITNLIHASVDPKTVQYLAGHENSKITMDIYANLTRIDNALAQMPQRLEAVKNQLDNLYQQQAAAKAEVGKPFPQEQELRDKSARLAELDVLLNMDGRGRPAPEAVLAKSSRPSVLEGLKRPVPRNPEKKPKHHEQEVR